MKHYRLFGKPQLMKVLADRLSAVPNVSRFSTAEQNEGEALAYAFHDLEEAFSRFCDELLPRLLREDLSLEEIDDTLHEVGEEFRHILYHIHDPQYYKYLFPVPDD